MESVISTREMRWVWRTVYLPLFPLLNLLTNLHWVCLTSDIFISKHSKDTLLNILQFYIFIFTLFSFLKLFHLFVFQMSLPFLSPIYELFTHLLFLLHLRGWFPTYPPNHKPHPSISYSAASLLYISRVFSPSEIRQGSLLFICALGHSPAHVSCSVCGLVFKILCNPGVILVADI